MTADIAARLIEGVRALCQDVLIDYEHNQLRKMQQDIALPPEALAAAGWFNADEMLWRENEGLFIKPRWTPAALQRIDAGEFGYLSAVFPYAANGEVLALRMAALTNDPGATGMRRLVALAAELDTPTQPEKKPMNEKIRQLLARLGIDLPENGEITDEQATAALSAFDAVKAEAGKVAALSAGLESAKSAPAAGAVDLTKYVPVETYNALRTQLADVSGQHSTATLSAVLDAAEREGRIFKSEREYLEKLGGQIGVAALSAQLEQKQPIAALTAMQTTTTPGVQTKKERIAALSADEKAAAKALGMTDTEYLAIKKEDEQA